MRQGKRVFRHESLQDSKTIKNILKSITNGMGSGKLTFSDEDDTIVMNPEGLLHLKLTATQDENRHRINVRISWHVEEETKKQKKNLSVSSK